MHLCYVNKPYNYLFEIGDDDIYIRKQNTFKSTIYQNDVCSFDYQGIKKALIGKTSFDCFSPKRIMVFQME